MKRLGTIFISGVVLLAVAWGIWAHYQGSGTSAASNPATPAAELKPPDVHPYVSTLVQPQEMHEFQKDQAATLQTDTDVATQYKALLDEMAAQQKELDAAMLQADPKVAPALATLELIRKHVPAPDSTPAAPKIYVLTPAEWKEIQTARMAALTAHPDFDQKAKDLAVKMAMFQQKLRAAMVKADPAVAPIMAKLQTGPPQPIAPQQRPTSE